MPDNTVTIRGGRDDEIMYSYTQPQFVSYANLVSSITQNNEYKNIKSHDYNPENFIFHKLGNEEELYLGIELEVDNGGKKDENAKLVMNCLGEQNVYCKHDGSLSNGFEIVSHPCTLEYHKSMSYENTFNDLTKLGYRSHDVNTCGLHVHFNRNYFAKDKLTQDLCISKLLYLFEKFWDKIVLIARRDSNGYARRYFLSEDETILDMYAKSKNSDKYGVINLKHKNTVEIRIFKGTLNYNTFISTLEFVKTIVLIAKDIDIYNIQYLTWNDIQDKFTDSLNTYIEEREKIEKEKKQEKKITQTPTYSIDWRTLSSLNTQTSTIYEPVIIESCNTESYRDMLTRLSGEWNNLAVSGNEQPLTIENMNINQLRHKMSEIQRQINRSRNPLERQSLQREIQQYANRISQLRRNRN